LMLLSISNLCSANTGLSGWPRHASYAPCIWSQCFGLYAQHTLCRTQILHIAKYMYNLSIILVEHGVKAETET
jgi:hypothetical protein